MAGETDTLVGTKVGKYELVRKLGHGGMGRIYEALNPSIGKKVALKLLDPALAASESAAARFTREAQAASAATSPHIVEIYDAGIADDGSPWIAMELLHGESLSALIDREGKLEPDEAVRIVAQVLRGLIKAHDAGIVHRDLKPDNVFLEDHDHDAPVAKILDFGVSKVQKTQGSATLTREGAVIGTPAYMSPEQAQGETDVDARSDIWSVGAILYECLTGKLPFDGATYEQIIVRICTETPTPIREISPQVPERLASVVERCMRRDRSERVATAADLFALLTGEPASRSRDGARGRTRVGRTASSVGTDSTIEAQGVPVRSTKRESSSLRFAAPLGVAILVGAIAIVLYTRTSADDPYAQDSAATTEAIGVKVERVPVPVPVPVPAPAAPPPSVTAEVSATVSVMLPRPRLQPRPATSTPPPAPPKPTGVAGGLEIRRD